MADPEDSTAPAAGLVLRLDLPKRTYAPGERIDGTLVVTNDGGTAASFIVTRPRDDDGTLVAASGWAASARRSTDAITSSEHRVEPGKTARIPVTIRTESCGTEPGTYEPLPDGSYRAMAELSWQSDSGAGHWWSPLVPVTVGE